MRASRDRVISVCRFAAAMACRDIAAARRALLAARRARVPRRAAEECALMLVLYAGYPAALEGLRVLGAVWPGVARATREGERSAWRTRGERLCRRVYGPAYVRLVPAVAALHPDLLAWMLEEGYGRVLSRPGLSGQARERITVAVLVACGWRRQLVSHLLGAVRLGVPRAQVRSAFEAGLVHATVAARGQAGAAWREVFQRSRSA